MGNAAFEQQTASKANLKDLGNLKMKKAHSDPLQKAEYLRTPALTIPGGVAMAMVNISAKSQFALGTSKGRVLVLNCAKMKVDAQAKVSEEAINTITYCEKLDYIVCGTECFSIHVLQQKGPILENLKTITHKYGEVRGLVSISNSEYVVSCGKNQNLQVWNLKKMQHEYTILTPRSAYFSYKMIYLDKLQGIGVLNQKAQLIVYNWNKKKHVVSLRKNEDVGSFWKYSIDYSRKKDIIVSDGYDGIFRVWRISKMGLKCQKKINYKDLFKYSTGLAIQNKDCSIIATSHQRIAYFISFLSGQLTRKIELHMNLFAPLLLPKTDMIIFSSGFNRNQITYVKG